MHWHSLEPVDNALLFAGHGRHFEPPSFHLCICSGQADTKCREYFKWIHSEYMDKFTKSLILYYGHPEIQFADSWFDFIRPLVHYIVNSHQWKTSVITPVAKIPQLTTCSDYRPISVTPILSWVLEKLVVRKFLYPIFDHPTFAPSFSDQFAFRPLAQQHVHSSTSTISLLTSSKLTPTFTSLLWTSP